jgi:hypothetical protein
MQFTGTIDRYLTFFNPTISLAEPGLSVIVLYVPSHRNIFFCNLVTRNDDNNAQNVHNTWSEQIVCPNMGNENLKNEMDLNT